MSTPATIWLVLAMLSLGISLEREVKPGTGIHTFVSQFIVFSITTGLLYWGGFFDKVVP